MDYARNPSALAARNRSPIRFPNPARNVPAIRPGSRTIGATMQPALSTPFTHPYVPAMGLRSEKPHQGVRRKNPAPYRGRNRCKFRTALGLRAGCAGNRVRSRYRGKQWYGYYRKAVNDSTSDEQKTVRVPVILGLKSKMSKFEAREALQREITKQVRQPGSPARVMNDGSVTFARVVQDRLLS